MESADTYQGLRDSLKKRGIKNIPLPSTPMHIISPARYVNKEPTDATEPDLSALEAKRGMIRKKKA